MSDDYAKTRIVELFASRDARKWMKEARRPEIDQPHYPLGWLPLSFGAALRELVETGTVSLVELPPRVAGRTAPAVFIVSNRK